MVGKEIRRIGVSARYSKATVTVLRSADHASAVWLPIVP